MENRRLTWQSIHAAVSVHFLYLSELVRNQFDIVAEIRVGLYQMQIASKTDSVHRLTKERPADADPVFLCIQNRIAALRKGRRSAKSHREQVRVQTQLMGIHLRPGAETRFIT